MQLNYRNKNYKKNPCKMMQFDFFYSTLQVPLLIAYFVLIFSISE